MLPWTVVFRRAYDERMIPVKVEASGAQDAIDAAWLILRSKAIDEWRPERFTLFSVARSER